MSSELIDTYSPDCAEQPLRGLGCGLLTPPCLRQPLVPFADTEVDLDQVRRGSRAACRECCCGSGICSVCAIAPFCCDDGECRRVCAKGCDLERDDSGAFELPLEHVVPAGPIVAASRSRTTERAQGVLPRLGVGVRERRGASLQRKRLRRNPARLLPLLRAARDHGHEPRRERDRKRRGRASARRFRSGGEPVQERAEPQIEVVLGVQSRTSLRRQ